MANEFQFDVFLSHSAKDKAVAEPLLHPRKWSSFYLIYELAK